MPLKIIRTLGLPFLLAVATMTPAFAVDVIYDTTGSFSGCGAHYTCSGNTLTGPNNLSITFDGTAPDTIANVEVPPVSYAPFGTFVVNGPTSGVTDTVAAHFTLQVNQLAPTLGTETLVDTISGKIKVANSQVTLNFVSGSGASVATSAVDPINGQAALHFNIGNILYWVDVQTPVHPRTGSGTPGTSIINGAIDSTVPEPTFYALTGAGFISLFAMAIRRRRQVSGEPQ